MLESTMIEPQDLVGRKIVDTFDLDYPGVGLVLDDGVCVVIGHYESGVLDMWIEPAPQQRPS